MSNILLLTSSPRGPASHSTKVAQALVQRLKAENPGASVTTRDLAAEPVPHPDGDFLAGIFAADRAALSPAQREAAERSDALVDELLAADTVVIASAMINFGLTTQLKAWFDNVLRAGKTFRYTEAGAVGLATGKKAYLVVARGGHYAEGPQKAADFQEPYLRTLLGFIGVTDVETIAIEGIAFGPEHAEKAVIAALAKVDTLSSAKLAA